MVPPLNAFPSDIDSFSFQPTSSVQRFHLPPMTTDSQHFFVTIYLSDVLGTYDLKSSGLFVIFFHFRDALIQSNKSGENDWRNKKTVLMIFSRGKFLGVRVEDTSFSSL